MAQETPPPGSKRQALEALLERGLVMIHLDARRPGVRVPDYLADEHHLRLSLSYRFDLEDLGIDEQGVRATLSFRRQGFYTEVPWTAVFAMTQPGAERGWLWPADLPAELIQALEQEGGDRPLLHAVPEDAGASPVGGRGDSVAIEDPGPDPEEPAPDGPRASRRPHLRLVK